MMVLPIGKIHDENRQNRVVWRKTMGAEPKVVVAVLYEHKIK